MKARTMKKLAVAALLETHWQRREDYSSYRCEFHDSTFWGCLGWKQKVDEKKGHTLKR